MCLILLALDAHPEFRLVVAANRDEFHQRPTAPAAFWADAPAILAGRDLQAGGTWLGIDRRGRFAAVTNYRQGQREPAASRSRGHLVRDFLMSSEQPYEFLRGIQREAGQYNGFNLLAGDHRTLCYFSNREGVPRVLTRGIYGLSNHLLDTSWPKVSAGKTALDALLRRGEPELTEELLALLADRTRPPDDQLPRTGLDPEWERLLSSAFIASDEYGTRSSTVVLVSRDGRARFVERSFSPAGAAGVTNRFEVTLSR